MAMLWQVDRLESSNPLLFTSSLFWYVREMLKGILTLRKHRPRRREFGEILLEIVQREGLPLFAEILRRKASIAQKEGQVPTNLRAMASGAILHVRKLYGNIRQEGLKSSSTRLSHALGQKGQDLRRASRIPISLRNSLAAVRSYYDSLPSARERGQFALKATLYSASFLTGLVVGLPLPNVDLSLFRRGRPGNSVTLHSAPRLYVDTSLEWTKAILERASLNHELTEEDRQAVQTVEAMLSQIAQGVALGASAGIGRVSGPTMEMPLEAQEFALLEALFTSLADFRGNSPSR
jgi:hypothetical protein